MRQDDSHTPTRRTLLKTGGIALTSGLAGCISSDAPRENTPPPQTDQPQATETETPFDPTENPPAEYTQEHRDFTFPHHELPSVITHTDPTDLTEFGYVDGGHPNNQVFEVVVENADRIALEIRDAHIHRPIQATMHIRDAEQSYQTLTKTIEPQLDDFTHYTRTFDTTDITLPRYAGGFIALSITDTHPENATKRLAKRHQYVGIPHKNGTEWINSRVFNYNRYTSLNGGVRRVTPPKNVLRDGEEIENTGSNLPGVIRTIDTPDERIVFMATRSHRNGEVFGVSTHIAHDAYTAYTEGSEQYRWANDYQWESVYATEISHLQELGQKTATMVDNMHVTNPRQRIELVGDLVQMIPYKISDAYDTITTHLYEGDGDCGDKTRILNSILQNDPWNHVHGMIDCEINGGRHFVSGIDITELNGHINKDQATIISPTKQQKQNGFEDGEYAFFDMTWNADIGDKTRNVVGYEDNPIQLYDLAHYPHKGDRAPNYPPDY
jgi:hypothetical protein